MASKEMWYRTRKSARIAAARSAFVQPKNVIPRPNSCKENELLKIADVDEVPTAQHENSSIMVLNDDCLLEIFSHLKTKDLCAVKYTCQRLSELVDSEVERRFENKYVRLPGRNSWREASQILVTFGLFINHLFIQGFDGFRKFFNEHKVGYDFTSILAQMNLKHLRIIGDTNWAWEIPRYKLEKILVNTETLSIFTYGHCNISRVYRALEAAEKLKDLSSDLSLNLIDPKYLLKHVDLESIWFEGPCDSCIDFVANVKRLQHFKKLKYVMLGYLAETFFYDSWGYHPDVFQELGRVLNEFTALDTFELDMHKDMSKAIAATATNFVFSVNEGQNYIGRPKFTRSTFVRKEQIQSLTYQSKLHTVSIYITESYVD